MVARFFRTLGSIAKWAAISVLVLFATVMVIALGGFNSPFPDSDVTRKEPFAAFVGREYRVKGGVTALAWNDFPDKEKILVVSLMPSPGARNRFVSYSIPLQQGQRLRILSAWRHFALVEFTNYYLVSVSDAGLPAGVSVQLRVTSDGVPDPNFYEEANPSRSKPP